MLKLCGRCRANSYGAVLSIFCYQLIRTQFVNLSRVNNLSSIDRTDKYAAVTILHVLNETIQ